MRFLRTPNAPRDEPDPEPADDETLRPWLEAMGFADSEEKFAVSDDDTDDDDWFEPAAPVAAPVAAPMAIRAIHDKPHPQPDARIPGSRRFKLPVLVLGATALVSVVGMLLAAAYLAGFDRALTSKPPVVEAATPTVVAPAPPPPSPLPQPTIPAQVRPPVSLPPPPSPSVLIPPPASPDGAPAESPTGPASRARVVIHVPDDDPGAESRLDDAASRLAPKVGRLEMRHVTVSPNAREIRFFHPEDSPAAHAVAEMLSRLKGPWRVRNFSSFRPSPSEGTVEVWLPSSRAALPAATPPG